MKNRTKRPDNNKWNYAQNGMGYQKSTKTIKSSSFKKKKEHHNDDLLISDERDKIVHLLKENLSSIPDPILDTLVSSMPDEAILSFIKDGGFSMEKFLSGVMDFWTPFEQLKVQFLDSVKDISREMLYQNFKKIDDIEIDDVHKLKINESSEISIKIGGVGVVGENRQSEIDSSDNGGFKVKVTIEVEPNVEFLELFQKIKDDYGE